MTRYPFTYRLLLFNDQDLKLKVSSLLTRLVIKRGEISTEIKNCKIAICQEFNCRKNLKYLCLFDIQKTENVPQKKETP